MLAPDSGHSLLADEIADLREAAEDTEVAELEAEGMKEDVLEEIARRNDFAKAGNWSYPFAIHGDEVRHVPGPKGGLYRFLLLATRLDMGSDCRHGGENGTELFELLCREVALELWGGGESSKAMVFGTANREAGNTFTSRIGGLIEFLGEGGEPSKDEPTMNNRRDGGLDIVVVKTFADRRTGQLVGFGQCKTGTGWKDAVLMHRPGLFLDKYISGARHLSPVPLFFVAEQIAKPHFRDSITSGSIILDRCRIMQFARAVPAALRKRITNWVKAAITSMR
jgi:hypothetical protein